jgi:predicted P-loop ATPase
MNDGVWKEMRDEEGGQKENDQKKIAKDFMVGAVARPFTPLEKAADFVGYISSEDGG